MIRPNLRRPDDRFKYRSSCQRFFVSRHSFPLLKSPITPILRPLGIWLHFYRRQNLRVSNSSIRVTELTEQESNFILVFYLEKDIYLGLIYAKNVYLYIYKKNNAFIAFMKEEKETYRLLRR